jgi:hypothetical protein
MRVSAPNRPTNLTYRRTATPGIRKSVRAYGFYQTIKRNSDEIFDLVFSDNNGVGVERV